MGPRHLSRGIYQEKTVHAGAVSCFNGATASEPWNRFDGCSIRSACACFNGATASEPWNQFAASFPYTITILLQWGHGI